MRKRIRARPPVPGLPGLVWLVGLAWACASFPDLPEGEAWPTPARGVVVSEHPLASHVGRNVLERGGNAVDAAVATAFALAVVYPQAGNLGGGGFAIHVPHDDGAAILALDFRETAPARLTPEAFLDENGEVVRERALASHLAVGVPGSPYGLWELHQRGGGALPWAEVLAPAIELAADGFRVDPWLARDLADEDTRKRVERGPARVLFYPDAEPLQAGDLLVQRDLARTLAVLAEAGPGGFYGGPVGAKLIAEMRRAGGVMTTADLVAYRPIEREPLRGWFRGQEVITMPPPSSGGIVLLQVLSVLDGFPLDQERQATIQASAGRAAGNPDAVVDQVGISGRAMHWWIEAMRRAFADRAEHMGDPDFHPVPTEELLAPEWVARRRISIGERANPAIGPLPLAEPLVEHDTTHICVLDGEGNAVSLTTTLNTSFGTGILVPGAGFFLNNELDDFSIRAGAANEYGLIGGAANALAGGKRPLSSMTPTVVRDGGNAVTMVVGSPGGPRIISSVIQVILRTEVYGQGIEEAIRAPRVHQQWSPPYTRVERGWDALLLQDLVNRGHDVREVETTFGSVQGILLEIGGEPEAFSDARRGGAAAAVGRAMTQPATPPQT